MLKDVDSVVTALGGTARTAELMGVTMQAVSNAKKAGRFPYRWHMRIWSVAQERGLDIAPGLIGLDAPTQQEARDA